jgi:hypothetical protein
MEHNLNFALSWIQTTPAWTAWCEHSDRQEGVQKSVFDWREQERERASNRNPLRRIEISVDGDHRWMRYGSTRTNSRSKSPSNSRFWFCDKSCFSLVYFLIRLRSRGFHFPELIFFNVFHNRICFSLPFVLVIFHGFVCQLFLGFIRELTQ